MGFAPVLAPEDAEHSAPRVWFVGVGQQPLAAAFSRGLEAGAGQQPPPPASASWEGKFRSRSDVESYDLGGKRVPRRRRIRSDEPLELLGTNEAPNPQDLLLAALNACMMVGFVVNATKLGVRIDSLAIDSTLDLDLRAVRSASTRTSPRAPPRFCTPST